MTRAPCPSCAHIFKRPLENDPSTIRAGVRICPPRRSLAHTGKAGVQLEVGEELVEFGLDALGETRDQGGEHRRQRQLALARESVGGARWRATSRQDSSAGSG